MADWYKRSSGVVIREWVVPAELPWGACWNQVQQAIDQAKQNWIDRHQTEARIAAQDDRCITVPDNAVRVKVSDGEVIVFWEEELAPGTHNVLITSDRGPVLASVQDDTVRRWGNGARRDG